MDTMREGECDAIITGKTPEEMMRKGMEHLERYHPEAADRIRAELGRAW